MEMILQIKSVSLVAKWGIFACNVLPRRGQQAMPIQANTNPPKTPCPRCQKGNHLAKDHRSKFHKDGTKLTAQPLHPQVQGSNFFPVSGQRAAGAALAPENNRGNHVESLYSLCSISELLRTTPGSAGLDLSSATAIILSLEYRLLGFQQEWLAPCLRVNLSSAFLTSVAIAKVVS